MDDQTHAWFLRELTKSTAAVMVVASYFVRRGRDVIIRGLKKAPTHGDWEEYADGGDMQVKGKDGYYRRIEVKHLSVNFTCSQDWPFHDFIVCAKHSWDAADPKPLAYYILPKNMTHAAICMGETSKSWTVKTRRDSRIKAYSQEFYFCPLDLVTFNPITVP